MKIIHIIYDSVGNPWLNGGGAMRTHELYRRMPEHTTVEIVCGNYPNARNKIDGLTYKRLGFPHSYMLSRLSFFISAFFYVLFSHADIYIEDISPPMPLLVTRFKKKYFASVQFLPTSIYLQKRKFVGQLYAAAFRTFLSRYKNIITVSHDTASYLKKINTQANIIVIPNGVTTHHEGRIRDQKPYLLYLGRIDIHEKGIDTLLKAAGSLVNRHKAIQVILAGNSTPAADATLQSLITTNNLENHVMYIGFISGNAKNDLIQNSLCVVIPSRNETFGITALEAFSYGKPVIATLVGGMKELVLASNAALTFSPGDFRSLEKHIERMVGDSNLRKVLSIQGKKFSKKYSWEKISNEYRKVIE